MLLARAHALSLVPQHDTISLSPHVFVALARQYEKADDLRRALRLLNGYKIGPGELLLKVVGLEPAHGMRALLVHTRVRVGWSRYW